MGDRLKLREHATAFAVLCALAGVAALAHAAEPSQEPLSNLSLFARCYSHITGAALPRSHVLRAQVKAGAKSAVDACMEVLEKATLSTVASTDGELKAKGTASEAEGLLVLRNFNDFHRTWFPNDDFESSVPFGDEIYSRTRELHDEGEPGLHVTRALLAEGADYSDIVLSTTSMEALRTGGPWKDTALSPRLKTYDAALDAADGDGRGHAVLDAPHVQKGQLIGIRKMSLNTEKWNKTAFSRMRYYLEGIGYGPMPPAIRYNQPLGGGILGLQSYLTLNLGRPDYLPMDGGIRMNRRWSRAVMSEVLCRDLPALRASDAAPYVQASPTLNTPAFRTSKNCMACHSTLDPMAAVIRNLSYVGLPEQYGSGSNSFSTMHVAQWPASLPRESGQVDADPHFHKRPTWGRLHYRSYDGTLVKKEVSSLQQLGSAISESNDLYVCAASRYYRHFTGVQVSLQDLGDPANAPLSKAELAYRDEVIRLGLELKSHKSLKTLVRKIMELPVYRSKSMRTYGEIGEAE